MKIQSRLFAPESLHTCAIYEGMSYVALHNIPHILTLEYFPKKSTWNIFNEFSDTIYTYILILYFGIQVQNSKTIV